ncbi:MAG: hypothetical protein KatS3mg061_0430 [Dehalococcoidia bacterium]|nr:MAG: hypothetical protein KatS3mg061_0430 [Dehalococcoidia bacterium]
MSTLATALTPEVRHARMEEFLAVCEQAWAQDSAGFRYEGAHYRGQVARSDHPAAIPAAASPDSPMPPRPRQPMSGLVVSAGRCWSVRRSMPSWPPGSIYYFKGQREAGLTVEQREKAWYDTGVLRQLYVAAPGEDWRDTLGAAIENLPPGQRARERPGSTDLPREDLERRKEGYLKNWLFAGTAEELIERLRPFAELGFGHLMCWMTFGYLPDRVVRQSMFRFAAEVMPALRAIRPNGELREQIARSPAGATRPDQPVA